MMKKINEILSGKKFKILVCTLGVLIVALFIFQVGVFVGFHKASFGNKWGDNFNRTFGERAGHFGFLGLGNDFPAAHGAVGKIVKLELPNFVILGNDNVEKVIATTASTTILRLREQVQPADLHEGDTLVVIGSPTSNGEIEAKLIRVQVIMER